MDNFGVARLVQFCCYTRYILYIGQSGGNFLVTCFVLKVETRYKKTFFSPHCYTILFLIFFCTHSSSGVSGGNYPDGDYHSPGWFLFFPPENFPSSLIAISRQKIFHAGEQREFYLSWLGFDPVSLISSFGLLTVALGFLCTSSRLFVCIFMSTLSVSVCMWVRIFYLFPLLSACVCVCMSLCIFGCVSALLFMCVHTFVCDSGACLCVYICIWFADVEHKLSTVICYTFKFIFKFKNNWKRFHIQVSLLFYYQLFPKPFLIKMEIRWVSLLYIKQIVFFGSILWRARIYTGIAWKLPIKLVLPV